MKKNLNTYKIVEMRKQGKTFQEIGDTFGISKQRVQQICKSADDEYYARLNFLSKYIKDEYFCCGLHHSSYCPECRGERCENRIKYKLNPKGGNEKKIEEINKRLEEESQNE